MANEKQSNTPSPKAEQKSPYQAPISPPSPPKEGQVTEQRTTTPQHEQNVSAELAREFKWVEVFQIASNSVLAIVGIIALCIYNGQLGEMRKSSKAAQDAAEAAKIAAETATKQLELSTRPSVDAQIGIRSPLFYNVNGANITLHIVLHNGGHSPASATSINPRFFSGADSVQSANHVGETCADANRISATMSGLGTTVFPAIPFEQDIGVSVGQGTLEANQASKEFPGSKFPPGTILGYAVVVCIAYQPSFQKTIYDTAYVVDLYQIKSGQLQTAFKIGENIDASRLTLRLHPVAGIQAN